MQWLSVQQVSGRENLIHLSIYLILVALTDETANRWRQDGRDKYTGQGSNRNGCQNEVHHFESEGKMNFKLTFSLTWFITLRHFEFIPKLRIVVYHGKSFRSKRPFEATFEFPHFAINNSQEKRLFSLNRQWLCRRHVSTELSLSSSIPKDSHFALKIPIRPFRHFL